MGRCSAEYTTAEYSTLIDLTSELRLAVRSELISLTGSLLASRLISPECEAELRNTFHSEVERSARLVELIQSKVQQNPRHYHSFIGILQGNQDQYGDVLQRLEQAYQEHCGEQHNDGKHLHVAMVTLRAWEYPFSTLCLLHIKIRIFLHINRYY